LFLAVDRNRLALVGALGLPGLTTAGGCFTRRQLRLALLISCCVLRGD
jgi:hypothetical protein